MKKVIPYGRQCIDDDDIAAVVEALKSDYLTTGPKVQEFEEAFAEYVGAKYAVAVANGTAALHLACLAGNIGFGHEVITTPITFAASANCALYVGATPVFADIDPVTYNIDPQEILQKITPKTKAIVPVHYTGLPCDMERIHEIAIEHNLIVIEDACHALGAKYNESKIGDCTYSDMTVFSFHPVKHITTGEGGMITTNNNELYEKLIMFRSHGITRNQDKFLENHGSWYYEMQILGYNYRLTDIQCALGISQLKKADIFIKRRREIAEIYSEALRGLPLILPSEKEGYYNPYHLYVIKVEKDSPLDRNTLYEELKKVGVLCQVHYIPVHLLPYYRKKFGYKTGDYPHAEMYYQHCLTLPLYPLMTDEDVFYVIEQLKRLLTNEKQ